SNTMPDDDMTGRERDQADAEQSEMAAAATAGTSGQPTTLVGRVQERVENILSPIGQWTRPPGIRFILGLGGLLVLIALLANNGGLAMIIGAAVLPITLTLWGVHRNVVKPASSLLLAGFGIVGVLVGAILGWLGSLIVSSTWFDTGVLNYGAAGLGGTF